MEPSLPAPRLLSEDWLPILLESLQAFMRSAGDQQALAAEVARRASSYLNAACAVGVLGEAGTEGWSASAYAPGAGDARSDRVSREQPARDDPLIVYALEWGRGVLVPSAAAAELGLGPEASSTFGGRALSVACLPLISQGQTFGVLLVARLAAHEPPLSERDLKLGQHLAERAALALDHGRALANLSPIHVPQGQPLSVAVPGAVARERPEHARERSLELELQNRRLREASRFKREFLANMSHELRTPLNAIIGFSALLHAGKAGPISETQAEYLGDILTSSRHLLQLINDVLDLAKVEAGRVEVHPQRVDLARLVAEVKNIVRGLTAEKQIEIAVQIAEGLDSVVTDPRLLKQVLYNYLSNAIKFTAERGQIQVDIAARPPDCFRLSVRDTGIGIKASDIERLFHEFQQLDSGSAKRYPGTGLGLALTKRIVEAQGGSVAVTSEPGVGSVFSAELPLEPRAKPPEAD